MTQADSVHSTPRTDSSLKGPPPAAKKAEQIEMSRRAGYAAAFAAKIAGKPTPKAPRGVDGLSYASGAVEGAAAAGRDLDPRDVIAEILEEHLTPDPRAVADAIVEHLKDAGFSIGPTEQPKPPRTP